MTAAMQVAGGRGLPVPTWPTPIGSKSRESSAPPFLRRTPEELAAAELVPVVLTPAPKPRRNTPPKPTGRVVTDEEVQEMVAKYRAGSSYKRLAAEHAPICRSRVQRLIEPFEPKRGRGYQAAQLDEDEVVRLYVEERLSCLVIGKRLRTDPARIARLVKARGITVSRNGWRER